MAALKWMHGIYTLYQFSSQTPFIALMHFQFLNTIYSSNAFVLTNPLAARILEGKQSTQEIRTNQLRRSPRAFTLPTSFWRYIKQQTQISKPGPFRASYFQTQNLHRFLLALKQPLSSLELPAKDPWGVVVEQGRKCPCPMSCIPCPSPSPLPPSASRGTPRQPRRSPLMASRGGNPTARAGRTHPEVSPNIPVCPRTRNPRPVFCEP